MGPTQKGTSTSTQQTSFEPWVAQSQQNLNNWRDRYFQDAAGAGGTPLAGMNDTQRLAGNWYGALATDPQTDYASKIMEAGGPITGEQISEARNPFLKDVGRQVLTDMRREKDNTNAAIGARSANAVAFGGSGPALERAQLERGYGQNVARTMTDLNAAAWQEAAQRLEGNANRALSAATAAGGTANDALTRRSQAVDGLLRYGTLQQAQDQAQADRMRQLIDWYGGGLPAPAGTVTSNQPIYGNPLESILGLVF